MRNQGLGSWPARRARSGPHRTALLSEHGSVSYADLYLRVTRLAHALRESGLGRGDRIAYLGPNRPAFVESLFAAHTLGAVFVPLNTRLAVAELDHQLRDCGASVLIYSAENAGVVANLTAPPLLVAVDGGVDGGVDGALDYESGVRAAPDDPIDERVDHDDAALILYTSGTTGSAKGVVLTHGNVIWNCLNTLVELDLTGDEVTLVSAPLFHVAALNMTLLPTLLKGGAAVLMPGWDVDACFDLIERHRVTWMFGVPTMFADLARSSRWATADLSSVRSLLAGGAPVPLPLIRTYQERGLEFLQGFGLTEAAPGALILSAEMSTAKAGSAGVPHFFSDVRLEHSATADAVGEILIQGPTVMPGYWERPEATAAVLSEDGWLRTGDVGRVDEDGYFSIVDRIKDMYISGGENVYPAEVEAQLLEHPDVAECAVIGVPDGRWGEVGRAFVRTRPGAVPDRDGLIDFLTGRLARYKIPKTVQFVEDLPRTASGKIHKQALR